MRYFISIDIDNESVKKSIMNFTEQIQECGDLNFVSSEKLHITLLFIGERDKSEIDVLHSKFISVCEEINEGVFTCNLENLGVFPHMNYIKVVWICAKPREKLEHMHMKFSESIGDENEHDFVPHATVARVRGVNADEKSALQRKIERHQQEFGTFQVDNVRLKQSKLTTDGPRYEDVAVYEL